MKKVAFWVWLHAALLLSGVLVTVVLLVPFFQSAPKLWITLAALLSMTISVPLAQKVAAAVTPRS